MSWYETRWREKITHWSGNFRSGLQVSPFPKMVPVSMYSCNYEPLLADGILLCSPFLATRLYVFYRWDLVSTSGHLLAMSLPRLVVGTWLVFLPLNLPRPTGHTWRVAILGGRSQQPVGPRVDSATGLLGIGDVPEGCWVLSNLRPQLAQYCCAVPKTCALKPARLVSLI